MTPWTRPWTLFIGGLLLLHFVLRLGFGLGKGMPDLLTAAALLGAMRLRPPGAAALGLAVGIINDAASFNAFGATGFALAVVAALGALSREYFEGSSPIFVLAYLVLGSWLSQAIARVLGRGPDGPAPYLLSGRALLIAAYTGVAGILLLSAYRGVTRERI